MSNGTKKNIKIIIPSSLDDEGARMLVIPLLREPVLMQDVYQPNQVMRLLRISKPRFYELTDLKQRNHTHNYGGQALACDHLARGTHQIGRVAAQGHRQR